jgi:hypothetical protein
VCVCVCVCVCDIRTHVKITENKYISLLPDWLSVIGNGLFTDIESY